MMPRGHYTRGKTLPRTPSRKEISHAKLMPCDDPDFDPMMTDRENTMRLEANFNFWRENLRVKP